MLSNIGCSNLMPRYADDNDPTNKFTQCWTLLSSYPISYLRPVSVITYQFPGLLGNISATDNGSGHRGLCWLYKWSLIGIYFLMNTECGNTNFTIGSF